MRGNEMEDDYITKLRVDFPFLQKVRCGVSFGRGWEPLIRKLCEDISEILKGYPEFDFRVEQIKEKFGGLRFYPGALGQDLFDPITDLISAAEQESYKVCEDCGAPGEIREGGWIRVLCEKCHAGTASS